jgi:hypothetical protein
MFDVLPREAKPFYAVQLFSVLEPRSCCPVVRWSHCLSSCRLLSVVCPPCSPLHASGSTGPLDVLKIAKMLHGKGSNSRSVNLLFTLKIRGRPIWALLHSVPVRRFGSGLSTTPTSIRSEAIPGIRRYSN